MARIEDEPYSTPWLRKYRSEAFQMMEGLAKDAFSPPDVLKAQKRIVKLNKELRELHVLIRDRCTHPVDSQQYSECGREDTLGCYRRGMDYTIKCKVCGEYLKEWGD